MTRKEWASFLAYSGQETIDTKRYRFHMENRDGCCFITRTLLRGEEEVPGHTEKYAAVNMFTGEVLYARENKRT